MGTGVSSAIMRALREDALREQGKRCYYCLDPICIVTVTGDHKTPRARGGSLSRENIVAACQWCNLLKGHQDAEAFMRLILHPSERTPMEYHIIRARRLTTLRRLLPQVEAAE